MTPAGRGVHSVILFSFNLFTPFPFHKDQTDGIVHGDVVMKPLDAEPGPAGLLLSQRTIFQADFESFLILPLLL